MRAPGNDLLQRSLSRRGHWVRVAWPAALYLDAVRETPVEFGASSIGCHASAAVREQKLNARTPMSSANLIIDVAITVYDQCAELINWFEPIRSVCSCCSDDLGPVVCVIISHGKKHVPIS